MGAQTLGVPQAAGLHCVCKVLRGGTAGRPQLEYSTLLLFCPGTPSASPPSLSPSHNLHQTAQQLLPQNLNLCQVLRNPDESRESQVKSLGNLLPFPPCPSSLYPTSTQSLEKCKPRRQSGREEASEVVRTAPHKDLESEPKLLTRRWFFSGPQCLQL